MKKITVLTKALTLLLGISITSCLGEEESSIRYGQDFAKVYASSFGGVTFQTINGGSITPSSASIAQATSNGLDFSKINGQVVYVYYYWDSNKLTIPEEAKDISGISLQLIEYLDSPVEIVENEGAANDSTSNIPIISIGLSGGFAENYKPIFFDQTTLMLPINYYIASDLQTFTLNYYPNKEENSEESSDMLTLYLRHDKQKDQPNSGSTTSASQAVYGGVRIFWRSFDLEDAMSRYMAEKGLSSYPSQVRIVTEENSYSVNIEDATEKEYTITYNPSDFSDN